MSWLVWMKWTWCLAYIPTVKKLPTVYIMNSPNNTLMCSFRKWGFSRSESNYQSLTHKITYVWLKSILQKRYAFADYNMLSWRNIAWGCPPGWWYDWSRFSYQYKQDFQTMYSVLNCSQSYYPFKSCMPGIYNVLSKSLIVNKKRPSETKRNPNTVW